MKKREPFYELLAESEKLRARIAELERVLEDALRDLRDVDSGIGVVSPTLYAIKTVLDRKK